jgi:hypothetical protein
MARICAVVTIGVAGLQERNLRVIWRVAEIARWLKAAVDR